MSPMRLSGCGGLAYGRRPLPSMPPLLSGRSAPALIVGAFLRNMKALPLLLPLLSTACGPQWHVMLHGEPPASFFASSTERKESMKEFIKSIEGKDHGELSEVKARLVREKLRQHREGNKEAVLDIHRKIELVKVTMAALVSEFS